VNKTELRDAILQQLRTELSMQTRAAELSRDEAISEESRAENKWDTHSQEAAYLAEGQAKLAGEIGKSIEIYATLPLPPFGPQDPIAVGAVIGLDGGIGTGKRTWYFLGPRAGGMEVTAGELRVLVLTALSPLGRQLLGKRVGDSVIVPGRSSAPARIAEVK